MKLASCAWRIKQVSHGAPDNRAHDTEHDCPGDREMRMHERLGDTTNEEANKHIPNEMKHCFLLVTPAIWKSTVAIAKSAIQSHAKEMTNDKCRMMKESRMPNG
jgi:hypothetical protein